MNHRQAITSAAKFLDLIICTVSLYLNKMIVSVAVGKAGHTGAHISPASCTDLACPAFLACLVDHNVADFVDDSGLDLEISREWILVKH